jgi:hypothetical protein
MALEDYGYYGSSSAGGSSGYDMSTPDNPNLDIQIPVYGSDTPNIDWSNITLPSGTSYGPMLDYLYANTATGGDVSTPGGLDGIFSAIKKFGNKVFFDEKTGDPNWKNIATIGGGLAGLLGTKMNKPAEKVGYQGKIPALTAVREQVPQSGAHRPGAGGRRYFSDVQYVAPEQAAAAQQSAAQQAAGLAQLNAARPAPQYAEGGITGGYYLGGKTDGMADEVPAHIDGKQPAKLSDGEFVVPADVVSHLGNGNSEAGAQRLYEMMDRIRKARTGTKQQGKQINPNKFLPK